jgi:hypothetical protein
LNRWHLFHFNSGLRIFDPATYQLAKGRDPYSIKASPEVRKAFKTVRYYFKALNLTYLVPLFAGWNWHLFPPPAGEVVKASSGHIPQPFLISNKDLVQRKASWG